MVIVKWGEKVDSRIAGPQEWDVTFPFGAKRLHPCHAPIDAEWRSRLHFPRWMAGAPTCDARSTCVSGQRGAAPKGVYHAVDFGIPAYGAIMPLRR